MVKECKENEVLNPKTNRCVSKTGAIGKKILAENMPEKKCKDDEVLNPVTKRCVSKKGVVGKKIIAGQQQGENKKEKTCKPDEILNPDTKRCVKKSGKIGKMVAERLAKIEKENVKQNVKQNVKNAKKDENDVYQKHEFDKCVYEMSGKIDNEKTVTTIKKGKADVKKFDTVQQMVKHYRNIIKKSLDKGWVLVKQSGQSDAAIDKILDNMGACKKKTVKPKFVNVNTCENDSTLVMMEPLTEIEPEQIVKLSDGYCFDIEEIIDYCSSVNSFKNPLTNNAFNDNDVVLMSKHPKLTDELREKLDALQAEAKRKKIAIVMLQKADPKLFEKFFLTLLLTGLVSCSDYSPDFKYAQEILSKLSTVIAKFDADGVKKIMSLTTTRGDTLESIMKSYANTCIHGVGYKVCNIMFNQLNILKANGVEFKKIPSQILENPLKPETYLFAYVHSSFANPSLNLYDPSLKGTYDTVRMGALYKDGGLDIYQAYGVMPYEASKYYKAHLEDVAHAVKAIHQKDLKKLVGSVKV